MFPPDQPSRKNIFSSSHRIHTKFSNERPGITQDAWWKGAMSDKDDQQFYIETYPVMQAGVILPTFCFLECYGEKHET